MPTAKTSRLKIQRVQGDRSWMLDAAIETIRHQLAQRSKPGRKTVKPLRWPPLQ
jgi:hypothetical protein